MNRTTALATLARHKLRITRSREALVDAMLKAGVQRPFSAADLRRALHRDHAVDLVTVYRNLEVFARAGLICPTEFSDGEAHFTLAVAGHAHHHHHHVICRKCHRVSAVDSCALDVSHEALSALGFTDVEHRLEFTGTCAPCRRR